MKVIAKENCPFCERVELGLKTRKIPGESVLIEKIADGLFPEKLVKINPNQTFPTFIVTSSLGFAESMVILEYIDSLNANGPKLYGNNPEETAKTKFNIELLSKCVTIPIQKCIYTYGSFVEEKKALLEVPFAFENLSRFLEERGTRFLGGEDLNAEDIQIIPFIMRYLGVKYNRSDLPLPKPGSLAEKYFNDISNHSLVRKHLPHIEELGQIMKKHDEEKGINSEKIKLNSRKLVVNLEERLNLLNENLKFLDGWKIGKNDRGNFIYRHFKFVSSDKAIKAIHILNEIQESSDHHSNFNLDNFSTLTIELCTHNPIYGVTEVDLAFAEIYSNKVLQI